jgi:hypothetical protein
MSFRPYKEPEKVSSNPVSSLVAAESRQMTERLRASPQNLDVELQPKRPDPAGCSRFCPSPSGPHSAPVTTSGSSKPYSFHPISGEEARCSR